MNKIFVATRESDYDEYAGFVIIAENEEEAKKIAWEESLKYEYAVDYENEFEFKEVEMNKKGVVLASYTAG